MSQNNMNFERQHTAGTEIMDRNGTSYEGLSELLMKTFEDLRVQLCQHQNTKSLIGMFDLAKKCELCHAHIFWNMWNPVKCKECGAYMHETCFSDWKLSVGEVDQTATILEREMNMIPSETATTLDIEMDTVSQDVHIPVEPSVQTGLSTVEAVESDEQAATRITSESVPGPIEHTGNGATADLSENAPAAAPQVDHYTLSKWARAKFFGDQNAETATGHYESMQATSSNDIDRTLRNNAGRYHSGTKGHHSAVSNNHGRHEPVARGRNYFYSSNGRRRDPRNNTHLYWTTGDSDAGFRRRRY